MRSHASLLLLAPMLIAAQQPDASVAGPRGTAGNGEAGAFDRIQRASVQPGSGFTATHAQLPLGSVAEITDLATGHIILVQVSAKTADISGAEITLSAAAARALGFSGERGLVRVRSIQPSASDLAALRAGGSASPRLSAPDALLRALRREVATPTQASPSVAATVAARSAKPHIRPPVPATAKIPTTSAATKPTQAAPAKPRASGPMVQIAALRDEVRARAVARSLGGYVEQASGFWRVRLGPFADRAAAQRARDAAISRGYGGASIIQAP